MTGAAAPRAGEHALVWPVKESFLAYVNRTGGRITIVAPAYPGTDGFAFPHVPAAGRPGSSRMASGTGERALHSGELAFTGGVAFRAHGGVLDVTLAEPVLVFDDQSALLTVVGTVRPGGGTRAVIAVLADEPHVSTDEAVSFVPLLTDDGSALFGGVYPPGAAMDPLSVPHRLLATIPRAISRLDG